MTSKTAQARLDVAHAEIEMARTEAEALRHHNAELESTLAEFRRGPGGRGRRRSKCCG